MSVNHTSEQQSDQNSGEKSGPSGNQIKLYKSQGFFDKDKIISSITGEVVKQWFLHPYTGVGPHSVSFSQSLTNRDIINMYSQSGNYYYHTNCYNASYLTSVLTYYQFTHKPVVSNSPEKIQGKVESTADGDQKDSLTTNPNDHEAGIESLKHVDPNVRIYYSQINHIPIPIWNDLSQSTKDILKTSTKHRLTIGGRLVQPREWKNMTPFDITKWGKSSKTKLNAGVEDDSETDLNNVFVWPLKTITGNPGTDYITAPDFDPLPDKSGYYTKKPFPIIHVSRSFKYKVSQP